MVEYEDEESYRGSFSYKFGRIVSTRRGGSFGTNQNKRIPLILKDLDYSIINHSIKEKETDNERGKEHKRWNSIYGDNNYDPDDDKSDAKTLQRTSSVRQHM